MLTALNIVLILLSVLAFTIISEARVGLDLYNNANSISFYLFGIKIITIDIDFFVGGEEILKVEIKNKDKNIATLTLDQLDKEVIRDTLKQTLPNPFYNLDIVEVDAYAEYGGENAFRTAMVVSALKSIMGGALLYLISTQRARILSCAVPNFGSKTIILNVSGIFCITLADIIFGIIFSKKGEKKNDIGK